MIAHLQKSLKELEHDIQSEEAGAEELRRYIDGLQRDKAELEKQVRKAQEEVQGYEGSSGVFEREFGKYVDETHRTYTQVRNLHNQGMDQLNKGFGYHRAYRRHNDQFNGTYFTPRLLTKPSNKAGARE